MKGRKDREKGGAPGGCTMGMAAIAKNQTGNKNKNKSENKAKKGTAGGKVVRTNL